MYRERHAQECDTNGRSLMSHLVDDQLGLVFGSLTIPVDWPERMASLATTGGEATNLPRLQERRKRLFRAYAEDEDQFNRKLAEIDSLIRTAQPVRIEDGLALLSGRQGRDDRRGYE